MSDRPTPDTEQSDVPVADQDEVESSITESVRDRFERKELSDDKKDELRSDHTHHLVRNTHSQVTIKPDVGPGIEAKTTVEIPDMFCFTCGEWVGLSGVDLRGKPRSKDDAYYLGGPPESVTELRSQVQNEACYLASKIIDKHPHIDTPEGAAEFVQTEVSRISDRMVVADSDVPDDPDPLPTYEGLVSESGHRNNRDLHTETEQTEGNDA